MPSTCILCGKDCEQTIENICESCFSKKYIRHVIIPENIDIEICADCDSVLLNGQWQKIGSNDDKIRVFVENTIKCPKELEHSGSDLEIKWEDKSNASVLINAHLIRDKIRMEKELKTRARLKKNLCQSCSRQRGKYYEAILQVRGSRVFELRDFIEDHIDSKKPEFFISRVEELKNGLDFYLSNVNVAKQTAHELESIFGGEYGESAKLYGVKDGKSIYRMTYLIRLPEYRVGDFIMLDKKVYRIKNQRKKNIVLTRLLDGTDIKFDIKVMDKARIVGGAEIVKEATVLHDTGKEIQIMDPDNFQTITVVKTKDTKIQNGIVHIVKVDEDIYIAD